MLQRIFLAICICVFSCCSRSLAPTVDTKLENQIEIKNGMRLYDSIIDIHIAGGREVNYAFLLKPDIKKPTKKLHWFLLPSDLVLRLTSEKVGDERVVKGISVSKQKSGTWESKLGKRYREFFDSFEFSNSLKIGQRVNRCIPMIDHDRLRVGNYLVTNNHPEFGDIYEDQIIRIVACLDSNVVGMKNVFFSLGGMTHTNLDFIAIDYMSAYENLRGKSPENDAKIAISTGDYRRVDYWIVSFGSTIPGLDLFSNDHYWLRRYEFFNGTIQLCGPPLLEEMGGSDYNKFVDRFRNYAKRYNDVIIGYALENFNVSGEDE